MLSLKQLGMLKFIVIFSLIPMFTQNFVFADNQKFFQEVSKNYEEFLSGGLDDLNPSNVIDEFDLNEQNRSSLKKVRF